MCLSLFTDESKRHVRKKWERLTSSIWTKLFAIIFFIQFILVIFFQVRILVRNYSIYDDRSFAKSYDCDNKASNSHYLFIFSALQSAIFMILQLFLVYFGLNAIFHEHIIQIITLVVLNFGSAAYSLAQLLQIKIRVDRVKNNKDCSANLDGFKINWLSVDLPQFITLSIISIISAIVASNLYKQFGWSVYKRIGGDFKIQRIYRSNLIFLMLLKLNLFFWILYIIPTIILSVRMFDFSEDRIDMILTIYHSCATLLALILQILAYRSIKRESRKGMIIFSVLWLFIITDYGLLIYAFVRFLALGSYFLIVFTSVFVLIAIATYVYSIIVAINFGRGLKEAIENHKKLRRPTVNVPTLNIPLGSSSSSAYSPASSISQQFPPTSPLSFSDSSSQKHEEKKDDRWTIDD